jgi:uncharacterized membrane protein
MQNRRTLWVLVRLLLAGAVAAVFGVVTNLGLTLLASNLRDEIVPLGFVGLPGWAFLAAVACGMVAVAVYVFCAWLFRVPDISEAWRMVAGRIPGLRGRAR